MESWAKRMVKGAILIGGAAVLAGAMAGRSAADSRNLDQVSVQLEVRTLERSLYGEYLAPVALVANRGQEWDAIMQDLAENGQLFVTPRSAAELEQLHGIDWTKESVLLIGLGHLPAADEEMEVVEVSDIGGLHLGVRVQVRRNATPSQNGCSPYHLLVIPHANWAGGEVVYEAAPDASLPLVSTNLRTASGEVGTELSLTLGAVKAAYRE